MKAKRLPVRKQRALLAGDISEILKAGSMGSIVPNEELKIAKDTQDIPDYVFRPDANPELSFLVFTRELLIVSDSSF